MSRALGWAALAATVAIWAGYLISTRLGMTSDLTPVDIGLMRSGTAALVFLPVTIRHGLLPGGANWKDVLFIGGFGGTAFVFLLSNGLKLAPVADSGVFTPSMLPVFVALISVLLAGARYAPIQMIGLGLIVCGALAIGGLSAMIEADRATSFGHVLFLSASCAWAAYTVRFRLSGLSALHGATLLATWSALVFLALIPIVGVRFHLLPWDILAIQVVLGMAAGVVANFTYLYAIARLGAPISAASAALVPVLAAFGGYLFLEEGLGGLKILGIVVVCLGVLLTSGIISTYRGSSER